MKSFSLPDLMAQLAASDDRYLEFLRVPALSVGLYTLAAGGDDPQGPHDEDEVYYVVAGRATLHVAGTELPVAAGSLVFVPARAEHYFHAIEEELTTLVFFAPAEGSHAT